jgi:hypothetical protein
MAMARLLHLEMSPPETRQPDKWQIEGTVSQLFSYDADENLQSFCIENNGKKQWMTAHQPSKSQQRSLTQSRDDTTIVQIQVGKYGYTISSSSLKRARISAASAVEGETYAKRGLDESPKLGDSAEFVGSGDESKLYLLYPYDRTAKPEEQHPARYDEN